MLSVRIMDFFSFTTPIAEEVSGFLISGIWMETTAESFVASGVMTVAESFLNTGRVLLISTLVPGVIFLLPFSEAFTDETSVLLFSLLSGFVSATADESGF